MPSKLLISVAAITAVAGLACSLASASVTIYGGPTYDSSTGTGYLGPFLRVAPGATAGNATVVGYADKYSSGTWLGCRAVRREASGAAIELGNLGTDSGGWTDCEGYAINGAGTAVGYANKYSGGVFLGLRAVRWDSTGTAANELGNLGIDSTGRTYCGAFAVNNAGAAVGQATKYSGGWDYGRRAVRWDASGTAATELGNLGTDGGGWTYSEAFAINSAGTAVGFAHTFSNGNYIGDRAVRWDASATAATELGNLGTYGGQTFSYAYAINGAGTAVGRSDKCWGTDNYGYRAVRWDASGTAATELGNLGDDSTGYSHSAAYAVNGGGSAVGWAEKYSGGTYRGYRAVRWDASGTAATELGNLGEDVSSWAYAINDVDVVVGVARNPYGGGTCALCWGLDGVAIDLNTLLSPADAAMWTLIGAYGISDTNWVTGIGTFDPDGPGRLDAYDRMFLLQLPDASCLSDFNHDGFVNGDDYDLFASLFDVADPGADINSDGFVNGDDYDAFASAFDAGC